MKCIFLDFDGVINNWYHFEGVSLDNALILLEIIKRTNAKVIATTSRKHNIQDGNVNYYDSEYYNSYVKQLNALGIEIHDMTPKAKTRTLEILKYL